MLFQVHVIALGNKSSDQKRSGMYMCADMAGVVLMYVLSKDFENYGLEVGEQQC